MLSLSTSILGGESLMWHMEVTLDMINEEEEDDKLFLLQRQHATMVNEDFEDHDDDGQDVNIDNATQE